MAIYRRGAVYWWRRNLRAADLHPITIRVSLKTASASLAKARAAGLELEWSAVETIVQPMLRPDLAREDLSRIYHAAYKTQLDRIIAKQLATPMLEDAHAAANLAYARYFTLLARCTAPPVPDQQLLEAFVDEGLSQEEAEQLHMAIQTHRQSPPISHGQIGAYLTGAGVHANDTNKRAVGRLVAAGYRNACLEASELLGRSVPPGSVWPLPGNLLGMLGVEPPAHDLRPPMAEPQVIMHPQAAVTASVAPAPYGHPESIGAEAPQPASGEKRVDVRITALAEHAVARKTETGEWREDRARDVKAAVALFTAANGDLMCSQIRQHHISAMTALFPRLPTSYGRTKADREGGLHAALDRGDVLRKEWLRDRAQAVRNNLPTVGLSAVTHNKHLYWIKSLITFADGHGYVTPAIDPAKARMKQKKTKGPKRPQWVLSDLHQLFGAPIWTGCAGLWDRFSPGGTIFHDAAYWAPLLIATSLGRSDEPNGLMLDDIFEEGPTPYLWFRDNGYRLLKNGQSDRKLPICPKLLDLGFLDYVRAMRELGHELLFPELRGNSGFDHEFYDKVFEPLRTAVFPTGTSGKRGRKDVDVHSIRSTGLTLLRDLGHQPGLRQYLAGHVLDGETAASYEDDPPMNILLPLVASLGDQMLPQIQRRPLNLRPREWQKPGSPRGRRKKS